MKAILLETLARLPQLEVEVEEVTSVSDILEYQIAAAPALLINGRPVYQDEVPGVEELYEVLIQYQQKPRTMKKILVPTDFSEVAANAYRFAQSLAEERAAELKVIHAYHPSFDYSNPYLDMPAAEFEAVKRELMDNFLHEHTLPSEKGGAVATLAEPKSELRIGFAGEEVVRYSKEVDLIVMGTTGEGNLVEKAFGSVSTFVVQNAHCPVLLIPGHCRCEGFENVVFASNYHAADEAVLEQVVQMLGMGLSAIHFVHVEQEPGKPYAVEKVQYEQAVHRNMPDIGFNHVEIECAQIEEGVVKYAEEIDAGLIVTGTVHRSFLEKLFHKSVTKRLAFHTNVPLMVLHYDD